MGFFDRFLSLNIIRPKRLRGQSPARNGSADTVERDGLSRLGEQPDVWPSLDDETLRELLAFHILDYGATRDGARIPGLFALYRHAMTRFPVEERQLLLNRLSAMIEQNRGLGHMGLMVFLAAETSPGIRSSAALNLSALFDPGIGGELSGPRFVINTLLSHELEVPCLGATLGGVFLLGDRRVMPLLADAWDRLPENARLELIAARSGFVTEAMVEFWLDRLEAGCSEVVFGSVVAAIAKMPVLAHQPFVFEIERLLPAYAVGGPMKLLRCTPFVDYLKKIRPRLKALEAAEAEPKVIPRLWEIWENPGAFRDIIK